MPTPSIAATITAAGDVCATDAGPHERPAAPAGSWWSDRIRGVLRGTYAHPCTDAQLSLVEGAAKLGVHDLRPASPTYGRSLTLDLGDRHEFAAVRLPAGVAYAIWCTTATVHACSRRIGRSTRSTSTACRWDDPGLGFTWQPTDPVLSVRDALAGSLNAMRTSVAAAIG